MSGGNGLPKGWAEATMGALCGFITSGSRGWASHYSEEGSIFLRIGNLDHDSITLDMRSVQCVRPPAGAESDRTCVKSQDILVSVTADVGMIGVVPEGFGTAYINQHIALCRPLSGCYSPYIAWFLASRTGQKQFKNMQRGATKVGLGLDDVRNASVPIPPLPEQHRIVAKIEELFSDLDAGVQSLERAKANLKRYRASVLKAAVEGRLTEEWRAANPQEEDGQMLLDRILRERRAKWEQDQLAKFREKGKEPPKNWQSKYEEPAEPDVGELPELPAGWVWANIDQLANLENGDRSKNYPSSKHYVSEGVPFINAGHLVGGAVQQDSLNYITREKFDSLQAGKICSEDVLFCLRGSLGKVALAKGLTEGAIASSLVIIRPAHFLNNRFLLSFLQSPMTSLLIAKYDNGTAQPNLSARDLGAFTIPLPPLAEQHQIVALVEERLSQIDAAEKTIAAELLRAKRLRQGILKQAFEGKLVPQDPNDEPASVLLERIKAARAAEPPKKRTKRSKKATAK